MKILLATDGSEEARAAAGFLQRLPLPPGSRIETLCVVEDPWMRSQQNHSPLLEQIAVHEQEQALAVLQEACEQLSWPEVEVGGTLRVGTPSTSILLAAMEIEADLVVVGSRGSAAQSGAFMGSVARTVAACAARPVLVARDGQQEIREVVVATDGSHSADRSLGFLAQLPLPPEAQVTVVHVIPPFTPFPGRLPYRGEEVEPLIDEIRRRQKEAAAELLAAARKRLEAVARTVRTELRIGTPANEIRGATEERKADLIVAGARGSSLIEGLRVGSVTDALLQTTRCSVLVVH